MLVLPLIPFPAINPVLISIGPFSIRWYALAYIVGIIAGWFYARAVIARERFWGGPAPITVADYDDFIIWITHRHHCRRPHRLCAVLQSAAVRRASGADLRIVERRHVVSWRRRRLRRRLRVVRAAPRLADPDARRHHDRGGADRAVPRPHRQFHQRRAMGPADRRALGHGVSEWRPYSAASEPALRGDAGRPRAVDRARRDGRSSARSSGRA